MKHYALILILLCGCAANKVQSPQPMVRMLPAPAPQSLADIPQRSVLRPVQSPQSVVPSLPRPITLAWDYDSNRRWEVSHFRIYSTTTLAPAPWPLWITTTNQFITLLPTNTSRFFYCTAFGVNGAESLPNAK